MKWDKKKKEKWFIHEKPKHFHRLNRSTAFFLNKQMYISVEMQDTKYWHLSLIMPLKPDQNSKANTNIYRCRVFIFDLIFIQMLF